MPSLPSIPGYELVYTIGGGEMTCVWSARETATDDRVAVKMLRDDCADPETGRILLRREAAAGLSTRHPHLVRFRAASVFDSPFFVVMDLLPGESLRRRMQREYRLELSTALWIVRQTAEALAALHRAGFVHGDVKPENIRLTDSGTAVLIDLGFAHRPGENIALLEKGLLLGTANYLSPELCALDPRADSRGDVFSLGVLLFEMLTGQLPYLEGTLAETLRSHRHDFPTDLRDVPGDWPAGLRRVLNRLMARRPIDRLPATLVVQELIGLEIAVLLKRSA